MFQEKISNVLRKKPSLCAEGGGNWNNDFANQIVAYAETGQGSLLDAAPGSGDSPGGRGRGDRLPTCHVLCWWGWEPADQVQCLLSVLDPAPDLRWLVLELHVRAVMVSSPSIPDDIEEASAGGTARPAVGVTVGSKNCSRSCYIRARISKV